MSDTGMTAPLTGMAALTEAFQTYRDAGLRVPPVPHGLVDALVEQSPGVFLTAPMSLEDADVASVGAPQVGFGQIGHGVSSWFFCCRMVTASVAFYLRVSFGSAYVEDGSDADAVNAALILLEELVVAATDATESGRLPAGQRMVVVLDVLGDSMWQAGAAPAVESGDPVGDALEWLGQ